MPPYKLAQDFVEHSLQIIPAGHKVAMFLKLTFLEGKARRSLFDTRQLVRVHVSRSRISCGFNGEFPQSSSAVAYSWFIWLSHHLLVQLVSLRRDLQELWHRIVNLQRDLQELWHRIVNLQRDLQELWGRVAALQFHQNFSGVAS